LDVDTIADVHKIWASLLEEIQNPNVNNNELKERGARLLFATQRLNAQIQALPPQGRNLHFSGESMAKVAEQMGRIRGK